MELAFLVYAISLLTGLATITILVAIVCALAAAVLFLNSQFSQDEYTSNLEASDVATYEETKNRYKNKADRIKAKMDRFYANFKRFSAVAIVALVIAVLLPSEKTAWIMVGAYATQKVVTSPGMQETGDKVVKIINNKLDEYLVEGVKK